jgi:pyridoxine 5-phosphate synthase
MAGLGVNIDHVATVRQARQTVEPNPVWAAVEAELGGADGITFHLRKDRRHMDDRDARLLRQVVHCKLNMEMSMDPEIVAIAVELRPRQVTLVPENRQEVTTEGGLDTVEHASRLREVTGALREVGVEVSAFVDPVSEHIHAARDAGCDAVELHTGAYANAWLIDDARQREPRIEETLAALASGVLEGVEAGMVVHGGHGLTYDNIRPVAVIPGFSEFNIGHTIVARALFTGLREAVAEMRRLITSASPSDMEAPRRSP